MLKKLILTLILTVFMSCCLMTNVIATTPNPYPDTSYFKDSKLNVADLNDKSKYHPVGAVRMGSLTVSYHVSIGNIFPKYVSILWHGQACVGIAYYDSGAFHIWMKSSPIDPLFKKFPMIKHTQEAFKRDFEFVWKDVKFSLLTNS